MSRKKKYLVTFIILCVLVGGRLVFVKSPGIAQTSGEWGQYITDGECVDDAWERSGVMYSESPPPLCETGVNGEYIHVGTESGSINHGGLRVRSVPVPFGAVIERAYMELYWYKGNYTSGDVKIRIYGEDFSSPKTFDQQDVTSRSKTAASVPWTVQYSSGGFKDSPDISTVLQEIVTRSDWDSGDNMAFIIEDDGSTDWAAFKADEHGSSYRAKLNIKWFTTDAAEQDWSDGETSADTISFEDIFSMRQDYNATLGVGVSTEDSPRWNDTSDDGVKFWDAGDSQWEDLEGQALIAGQDYSIRVKAINGAAGESYVYTRAWLVFTNDSDVEELLEQWNTYREQGIVSRTLTVPQRAKGSTNAYLRVRASRSHVMGSDEYLDPQNQNDTLGEVEDYKITVVCVACTPTPTLTPTPTPTPTPELTPIPTPSVSAWLSSIDANVYARENIDISVPPGKYLVEDSSGTFQIGGLAMSGGSFVAPGFTARSERGWSLDTYTLDTSSLAMTYTELQEKHNYDQAVGAPGELDSLDDFVTFFLDGGTYKSDAPNGNFLISDLSGYATYLLSNRVILFIDGNLYINGNFATPPPGDASGSVILEYRDDFGPSIVFIVKGDLIIDPGVESIYGVFLVGGDVMTGSSDKRLYLFGLLSALEGTLGTRTIAFGRDLGSGNESYSGETFIFMPKYFFSLEELMGESSISWLEAGN